VYERNSATPETYKARKTITFLSEYTDERYKDYSAIIEAGLALCTPQCNVQPPLNTSDADIYIRDATGNVLAVYHYDRKTSQLRWSEQHLYGSARLGMYLPEKSVISVSTDSKQREVGYLGKQIFELSNHLGNVLATITDKKLQVSTNTTSTAYFEADVQTVQDYYAFGMQMPGRKLSGGYRYGFNGKENDNEVKGEGNQQDYGMRIYDGRIGKFLSTDPLAKKYPELSAYQFASNSPIENSDLDGAEAISEIKSGLARKMEMRVFSVSMKDAEAKVKENQIRALLYYYATNPNAHAKQSISEAPKEVSDRVRQLRREHFQDPETGEKTAAGRFFENTHYEKFNDNIVTPMAEAAIGEGAGKFLFRGGSLISRNAAKTGVSKLPTQIHHFATNKSKTFTPQMSQIADEFGLSLNGAWNKQALPHLGRHPNAYHNFVLDGMQKARAGAGGSQAEFLNLFNQYVKQPVIQNPGLLRKSGR
jgi:RHS repeat-associated protein